VQVDLLRERSAKATYGRSIDHSFCGCTNAETNLCRLLLT
jgi:hypothetical protein